MSHVLDIKLFIIYQRQFVQLIDLSLILSEKSLRLIISYFNLTLTFILQKTYHSNTYKTSGDISTSKQPTTIYVRNVID